MNLKDRLRKYFFGYDVFISYSRSDAFDYAGSLAAQLNQDGFSTFVDQAGTPQGKDVPVEVLRHAKLAGVLIVIGSPAALDSRSVRQEVEAFCDTGNPLLPVVFWDEHSYKSPAELVSSSVWGCNLAGMPISLELPDNLSLGQPSKEIPQRIALAVGNNRQRKRIKRSLIIASLLLGLLLVAWIVAGQQLVVSLDNIKEANRKLGQKEDEISKKKSMLNDLKTELSATLQSLSSSKTEARKFSAIAKREAQRAKGQEEVAKNLWSTFDPNNQDKYKQPVLECRDEKMLLDDVVLIYISPLWSVDNKRPPWPQNTLDILYEFAKVYNSCYRLSNNKPEVILTGHIGPTTNQLKQVSGELPYELYQHAFSDEFGIEASEVYAKWVCNTLIELGIPKDKINILAYASQKPRYLPRDDIGIAILNNRVEIRILDNMRN